jgi:hypothetical protein
MRAIAALVAALSASGAASDVKTGLYTGRVYGQVPGATPGVVQQTSNTMALLVRKSSVDVQLSVSYWCADPGLSQGGFVIAAQMTFLHVALNPNGAFRATGAFDQTDFSTASPPGGTFTISGRLAGTRAAGAFTRTAHVEDAKSCAAVGASWKATYASRTARSFP